MSDALNTLFKVQTYELQIDETRQRLDEIEAALAHDEELQQAQQAFEIAQATVQQHRAEVNNLELELSTLREKIETVNQMLYDGSIKNPKELQERQQEVESLSRRQEMLEYELREAQTALQQATATFDDAEVKLSEASAKREADNAALVEERAELDKMLKQTLRQRKAIVGDVPKPMMKQFRSLRKKKGQAIAPLNGNACGVCNIEQPSSEVRRIQDGDDIVQCVGCGRIIIAYI
jgi:uncharacterized protein